jgi:NTE family protein
VTGISRTARRLGAGCRGLVLSALVAALPGGCASLPVVDTTPLPAAKLAAPQSETISSDGYRFATLAASDQFPDLFVLVAMSGGGKRSAAFAYGALKGMGLVTIPGVAGHRTLLQAMDEITGVSGGSFTAAYYGLYRDKIFDRYEKDFLYSDTNSYIFGVYLLPWNWSWIVDPSVGTNDYMARVYDETMFHGATFKDLMPLGRPLIAIGATDISYGNPFSFTQETFDLICSDLSDFPIARAVAASNGFPGLFSPVTLTSRAADCGGRRPGWERRIGEGERHDPLSRLGVQAAMLDHYLDPAQTSYLHLADGGISDNLALRITGDFIQNLAQSPKAITARGADRIRRVLLLSIDGEGAQDTSVARQKAVGGLFSMFGLVSGGQIDHYNFETLSTVSAQLREAVQSLRAARCARGPTIDGAPCDDVQAELIHISLAGMPDGPEKAELLAIPTGLTLQPHDVDLLVREGQAAITSSAPLRRFLDGYPPPPPGAAPPEARSRISP